MSQGAEVRFRGSALTSSNCRNFCLTNIEQCVDGCLDGTQNSMERC